MTPGPRPRREHRTRADLKTITDSAARKKSPPHFRRAGARNLRSPRPVRDWIRHGLGLKVTNALQRKAVGQGLAGPGRRRRT